MQKIKFYLIPLILGIIIYSCEKEDSSVIDPILNIPSLDSARVSPLVFDTSRINATFEAFVTSVDPVAVVKVRIIDPSGLTFATVDLNSNGTSFTGSIDQTLECWLVGSYQVEFVAVTTAGLPSNTISNNFSVTNTNSQKPIITIIYAPDSLQRPSGTPPDTLRPAFLQVLVTDPDGPCDIVGAYFNAVNPNGIPNPLNPFSMYDDGDVTPPHCDTVANDGKYSLLIYIGPTATLGNFSFKFNANDRSGIVSDTVYKTINVYP